MLGMAVADRIAGPRSTARLRRGRLLGPACRASSCPTRGRRSICWLSCAKASAAAPDVIAARPPYVAGGGRGFWEGDPQGGRAARRRAALRADGGSAGSRADRRSDLGGIGASDAVAVAGRYPGSRPSRWTEPWPIPKASSAAARATKWPRPCSTRSARCTRSPARSSGSRRTTRSSARSTTRSARASRKSAPRSTGRAKSAPRRACARHRRERSGCALPLAIERTEIVKRRSIWSSAGNRALARGRRPGPRLAPRSELDTVRAELEQSRARFGALRRRPRRLGANRSARKLPSSPSARCDWPRFASRRKLRASPVNASPPRSTSSKRAPPSCVTRRSKPRSAWRDRSPHHARHAKRASPPPSAPSSRTPSSARPRGQLEQVRQTLGAQGGRAQGPA